MNTGSPPLDDERVRRAIAMAIDRTALAAVAPSRRREAQGILPPGLPGYSPSPKALAYDPDGARRMLAEAGHAGGRGLRPVTFYSALSTASATRQTNAILKRNLADVGITLDIRESSWSDLIAHVEDNDAPTFQLGWVADLPDPDSFPAHALRAGRRRKLLLIPGYGIRRRARARRGRDESDGNGPRSTASSSRQCSRRHRWSPLYHSIGMIASRRNVHGFKPGPFGIASLDLEHVWADAARGTRLMRNPFQGRTLEQSFSVSTALLVLVLIGTTMVVVENRVESNMRRGLEDRGTAIAESIAAVATPSLLAYNYAALQMAAEGAAGNQGVVYVAIHDKEGALAGVAGRLSDQSREHEAEVSADASSKDVEVERLSKGRPEQVVEVSVPVRVEGVDVAWGRVRVGLSYDIVASELRRLGIQLFALGALLAVFAVACVRWLARRITAPLRNLVAGTEALAAGELQHRIPVSGAKELADMAHAFNTMSDRLQEKADESKTFQDALERLNSTLEHQVIERTAALEESTAQYKSLVENSPDSILIVQDARVRFVNRAFADIFGIQESEVLHPDFQLSRIFDPSSAALAGGRIAAWERGETPAPAEVLGQDAQGRTRHLELRGSRIEYQGRPAAECLLVDMTEAKRLRERLSETEKLRSLGELASGVAHDFNNLLGAILGRAQLLRRSGQTREADHDLAVIEKAAQDGRETVRRIQEFSRTRRDKKFEHVNLGEILQDCLDITKTRWKDDALRRKVQIKPSLAAEPIPRSWGTPRSFARCSPT
jgi:PAS domain S-box-containing protein